MLRKEPGSEFKKVFETTINESVVSNDTDNLVGIARLFYQYGDKSSANYCLDLAMKTALNNAERNNLEKLVKWAYIEMGFWDKIDSIPELSENSYIKLEEMAYLIHGYTRSKNTDRAREVLNTLNDEEYIQSPSIVFVNDLLENGFSEIAISMLKDIVNSKRLFYLEDDNWGTRRVKFDKIVENLILNLALDGRIDLSFNLLGYLPYTRESVDILIKLNDYIKSNNITLTDDQLYWLRKIIHKDDYFCKYPLLKVRRRY